jgi:uncharacterized protein (DUF58 family)
MPLHRYKFFRQTQAAQLRRLELTVRGVVEGVYAGLHKSPHKGFSIEFAEHREYVPGDELKHLDWSVLARTDRHYIKQYEQETNLRATICLDASASMNYPTAGAATRRHGDAAKESDSLTASPGGGRRPVAVSKFDYAAVLAASIAYLLANQQDLVGLTVFDTDIRLDIPQGNGPSHLNEIFQQLEKITPSKQTNVADTLHHLANKIPRRGLVILISDLLDDPDKILLALQHLKHARHQMIVLQVLDPAELDLAKMGNRPVTFEDMEDNSRLQIDPAQIRDDYNREMQTFLDQVKRRCSQFRIDHILARTDIPWDTQIRELLRRTAGK